MKKTPVIYGASLETWLAYKQAGWSDYLLPVVSNPNAPRSPNSSLSGIGKIPSMKNKYGEVVGIRAWQDLVPSDAQIGVWSKDPDLGISIRCVNLVALDCDCDNRDISSAIYRAVRSYFGGVDLPIRTRKDAPCRWLLPIRVSEPRRKSRILFGPNNMLELLGKGNQFVAEGTHPKGARYEWTKQPTMDDIPLISPDRIDELVSRIITCVKDATGVLGEVSESRRGDRCELTGVNVELEDPLAEWLAENGFVISEGEGQLNLRCPWETEHTGDSGETATAYFFAGANGRKQPGFSCLHAHCAHRTYADLIDFARQHGFEADVANVFPELPSVAKPADPFGPGDGRYTTHEKTRARNVITKFHDEKKGETKATIATVYAGLLLEDMSHVHISADTFSRRTVMRKVDDYGRPLEDWRPVSDGDILQLWDFLETQYNYTPIGKDLMRSAVELLASRYPVDTLLLYLDKMVPEWDQVPRVEKFFSKYCSAENSDFSRFLGRYLFSALWGRATRVNGVKADIVPVLIGPQGARKSTLAEVLALKPEWFSTLSLDDRAENNIRKMTGRVVVELPELAGMTRRDVNDVKQFISQHTDTMVDKWDKYASDFVRRCLFIMTTNEHEILQDMTGSRRFAPIVVGKIDTDAVKRDLLQLWAEGRAIFEKEGIVHKHVEQLSAGRSGEFTLADSWEESIKDFIDSLEKSGSDKALTTALLLEEAVGISSARTSQKDSRRVSSIMRALGYENKSKRIPGVASPRRVWEKSA